MRFVIVQFSAYLTDFRRYLLTTRYGVALRNLIFVKLDKRLYFLDNLQNEHCLSHPAWANVQSKPASFPPADHTHTHTENQIIYVGKHGNDSNNGRSIELAKLTIGAGILAASEQTPGPSNRIAVQIVDAGTYAENVTMVSHVDVIGHSATLDGTITLIDNSTVKLREIAPSAGTGLQLLKKTSGTSASYAYIDRIDSRNVTNSICVRNQANGSVIFVWCAQMWVGAGNVGVGDQANGFGHVHLLCPDLYLAGNNALGIAGNSNSASIIGYIDHILETDNPTGTAAISVGASGIVHLTCTQIIADTAYTIAPGGQLNLVCPDIQGVRTGTVTTELSDQLVKSLQIQSTVATGQAPLVVASTTAVQNLNADLLDGYHASNFSRIIGEITIWPTDTPPDGWKLCNGQALSRTSYGDVFAILGTIYGSGDGSTTFNLPDLRGRFALGQDDMGGSSANRVTAIQADNLGQGAGAESHTLTVAELASHNHTQDAHNHTQDAHSHAVKYQSAGSNGAVAFKLATPVQATGGGTESATATNQATTATNQSTGGGSPHNSMPPYLTLNYIIYAPANPR